MAAMEIIGVFEVNEPLDPFWYDDPSVEQANIRSLGGDARAIDASALLAPEAYETALMVGQLEVAAVPHDVAPCSCDRTGCVASRLDAADRRPAAARHDVPRWSPAGPCDGTAMRSGLLPARRSPRRTLDVGRRRS